MAEMKVVVQLGESSKEDPYPMFNDAWRREGKRTAGMFKKITREYGRGK